MKIRDLINKTIELKESGFTIGLNNQGQLYKLEKGHIKKGYLISITNNKMDLENITESYIIRFIDSLRLLKSSGNKVFIGFWNDTDTNTYYLDLTLYKEDYMTSINMGFSFNQRYIFNLETWTNEKINNTRKHNLKPSEYQSIIWEYIRQKNNIKPLNFSEVL